MYQVISGKQKSTNAGGPQEDKLMGFISKDSRVKMIGEFRAKSGFVDPQARKDLRSSV